MKNDKVSIDMIRAILSMLSMALLAIQHLVGICAENVHISYIPLFVTFLTVFISAWGVNGETWISRVSLFTTMIIMFSGIIVYYISEYNIDMYANFGFYTKLMYAIIGILSLVLSILYIKRITEIK